MKDAFGFMKYHAIGFGKFLGIIAIMIAVAVTPFYIIALSFAYLFPIMGSWIWPVGTMAVLVLTYTVASIANGR